MDATPTPAGLSVGVFFIGSIGSRRCPWTMRRLARVEAVYRERARTQHGHLDHGPHVRNRVRRPSGGETAHNSWLRRRANSKATSISYRRPELGRSIRRLSTGARARRTTSNGCSISFFGQFALAWKLTCQGSADRITAQFGRSDRVPHGSKVIVAVLDASRSQFGRSDHLSTLPLVTPWPALHHGACVGFDASRSSTNRLPATRP